MSVGIVMLVHTALGRAEQVARHWHAAGCPVVIHIDASVPGKTHDAFVSALADLPDITFCRRHRCEWGTWGIVAATQDASQQMLSEFPEVTHVYLASGSCLPLRPVQELIDYLKARPRTDFIESATTADVPWTVGGWTTSGLRCGFRSVGESIAIFLTSMSSCSARSGSSAGYPTASFRIWEVNGGA